MKYLKYLVSIITAISISSVVSANEIKMGKADWDTGYFQAEIYKQALEKMGYKVSGPTVMKPQVFYVAATAGDVDLCRVIQKRVETRVTSPLWCRCTQTQALTLR